jgi:hypothetical protein
MRELTKEALKILKENNDNPVKAITLFDEFTDKHPDFVDRGHWAKLPTETEQDIMYLMDEIDLEKQLDKLNIQLKWVTLHEMLKDVLQIVQSKELGKLLGVMNDNSP